MIVARNVDKVTCSLPHDGSTFDINRKISTAI